MATERDISSASSEEEGGEGPEEKFWDIKYTTEVEANDERANEYNFGEILGSGSFGTVRLATRKVGDAERAFAIKIIRKQVLKKQRSMVLVNGERKIISALDKVRKEIEIMRHLWHRHVVLLFEVLENEDRIYMIVEYMNKGQVMEWDESENKFLCPRRKTAFPEAEAKKYFCDAVEGLCYLHSKRIVHRDIKPDNLLLTELESGEVRCVLSDLGVAQKIPSDVTRITETQGTYMFFAPECCQGVPFDPFAVDVWALGVTLFAFIFGSLPFSGEAVKDLFDAIAEQEPSWPCSKEEIASAELRDLLHQLLQKDPAERCDLAHIKAHPWVKEEFERRAKEKEEES